MPVCFPIVFDGRYNKTSRLINERPTARVIACTLALQEAGHSVFIVSNAPKRIFLGAITAGAGYRQADIDAGISQPKAYDVDRKQTLQGLREFLDRHGEKVQDEVEW